MTTNYFKQNCLRDGFYPFKQLITMMVFLFIATGNAIAGDWEKDCDFLYCYTGNSNDVRTPAKCIGPLNRNRKITGPNDANGYYSFFRNNTVETFRIRDIGCIGDHAFCDAPVLRKVIFENIWSLVILEYAFSDCPDLEEVIFEGDGEDEYFTLKEGAFFNCYNLHTFDFSRIVREIPDYAFKGCRSLTSITTSTSLEKIETSAFENCSSLTSVNLLYGLDKIGSRAFANTAIETINIPSSVYSLGNEAFDGCSALTNISVSPTNRSFTSINGILFSKDETEIIKWPEGITPNTYNIPESVTSIREAAFNNSTINHLVHNRNVRLTQNMFFNFHGTIHLPTRLDAAQLTETNGLYINYFPTAILMTDIDTAWVGETIRMDITDRFSDFENDNLTVTSTIGTVQELYSQFGKKFIFSYTPTQTTPLTSTVVFTVSDGYGTSETRLNIGRVGKVVDGNISFSPSEPCFNQPITATISDENFSGTPQYQWYINNELIEGATNESYIPLHSQIGQELSVRISSSSNMEKGIIEESAGIVNRGINPNIPTAPTIAYYTHNSLKIEEDNSQAYEYAVLEEYDQSSPQWQTSNTFSNLSEGTSYNCYRRIQSGTIYQASESSPATLVTLRTNPYSAIELTFKDYLTKDVLPNVYIEAYGNEGEWYGATNDKGTAAFVLPTSMQYRIYAEASGYVNHETNEVFIVNTGINTKTILMYPYGDLTGTVNITCDGTPQYGITLKTEFSAVNNNLNTLLYQWQRNGADVVGETNPTYEVDTVADIGAVISIEVSSSDRNGTINATLSPNPVKGTHPAPATPVVIGKSDTHITVDAEDGCEYMAFITTEGSTGSIWQTSNQFTELTPETEYTIYKRYAENDIYFASNYSSITEITTTTSSTTYEVTFEVIVESRPGIYKPLPSGIVTCNGIYQNLEAGNAVFYLPEGIFPYTVVDTEGETDDNTGSITVTQDSRHTITMVLRGLVNFLVHDTLDNGIGFAEICINNGEFAKTAMSTGGCQMRVTSVPEENYTYTVTKNGYRTASGSFTTSNDDPPRADIDVTMYEAVDIYNVSFEIKNANNNAAVANATITFNDEIYTTDANGEVSVADIADGEYAYSVEANGYIQENGIITVNGSNKSAHILLTPYTFEGTVSVITDGTLQFGERISLDLSGITTNILDDEWLYQWYSAGQMPEARNWTNSPSFIITQEDLSRQFYCVVSNAITDASIQSNTSEIATKANQLAPAVPALANITTTTVTLSTIENGEYAIADSANWNTSGEFTDLEPGTSYHFVQRLKATSTHNASPISNQLEVTTNELSTYSITFNVSDADGGLNNATVTFLSCNYATNSSGQAIINGVTDNTYSYTVNKFGYNEATGQLTINGDNETIDITLVKTPYEVTFVVTDSVTQGAISNASVTFNGTTYSVNGNGEVIFENVTIGTYNFDVTADGYVQQSGEIIITENAIDTTIVMAPYSMGGTISIITDGTLQYDEYIDLNFTGMTGNIPSDSLLFQWYSSNDELLEGYTFSFVHIEETDLRKQFYCIVSNTITDETIRSNTSEEADKADQDAPAEPTLASKTENSIILNEVEGCEYCVYSSMVIISSPDDLEWQSSAEFTGLIAGTEYACTQRYAETSTHNASDASSDILVTTEGGLDVPETVSIEDETFDSSSQECFGATQTIVIAENGNEVLFENGSITNLIAGQSIRFLPGTNIQPGAYVHAYITTDGSFCDIIQESIVSADPETEKSQEVIPDNGKITGLQTIKVYPNPSDGRFTIQTEGLDSSSMLHVYNSRGAEVYKASISATERLELSQLQKGLYIVNVINNQTTLSQRIIIK